MKLAFLYAGQGSQHVGMGADLYARYPAFRAVLDSAPVDFDLKALCFAGPEAQLAQTRYTQPCMVAFAAGMTAVLAQAGIRPCAAAGLSLGEYAALCAAGVFDAETAISLVALRGAAMEAAVQGRPCGMAAVLFLARELLQDACTAASALGVVEIANDNCPGQLVIAGDAAAVAAAGDYALAAGAKRIVPLRVSGAFHTSLMAPAGDVLRARFETTAFHPLQIPVYFNCTGAPLRAGETIPALLERQVQSSVYFKDSIRRMAQDGIDSIVEIGPGSVLSGFVKKIDKGIRLYAAETVQDVEALIHTLGGHA